MRARREPPQHGFGAVIVEAHAVDHGLVALQPEQPRPRIAGLRLRRHRADLDKAEAEPQQRVRHFRALVETGRHADRIGEVQAEGAHRKFRIVRLAAGSAAAVSGPGSPADAHPPDRTSAAAAARRRRRRGSRRKLRNVVSAVGSCAHVEHVDRPRRDRVRRRDAETVRRCASAPSAARRRAHRHRPRSGTARSGRRNVFSRSPRPETRSRNG